MRGIPPAQGGQVPGELVVHLDRKDVEALYQMLNETSEHEKYGINNHEGLEKLHYLCMISYGQPGGYHADCCAIIFPPSHPGCTCAEDQNVRDQAQKISKALEDADFGLDDAAEDYLAALVRQLHRARLARKDKIEEIEWYEWHKSP